MLVVAVVPTDTLFILIVLLIKTTSVLPLNFALHITNADIVETPTDCSTSTYLRGKDDCQLRADMGWVVPGLQQLLLVIDLYLVEQSVTGFSEGRSGDAL